MLQVVTLSENHDNGNMSGEYGLSLYVNFNSNKFLFDLGKSDLYIQNAKKIGLNLDNIENIVFSHGHYDHTTGIKFLQGERKIIAHPSLFKERYSARTGEYAGVPMSEKTAREKYNVFLTKTPIEIFPLVWFLGEIPMTLDFEKQGHFASTIDTEFKIIDPTEDDSGVAFETPNGLVILCGCGHRGICNIIEYAKKVTGKSQIYAVLGGFHLKNLETERDTIDKTIDYFRNNSVKNLYMGHCTNDKVIDYIEENLKSAKIFRLAVGKMYDIELKKNLAENL